MSKKDPEQLELKDKPDKAELKTKISREKKPVQYEGSRWTALVMLIITTLIGLGLYLTGQR